MSLESILWLLAFAYAVAAQQCSIQFDGRIALDATAASFDTSSSPFNPSFVFGQSQSYPSRPSFAADLPFQISP